MSADECSGYFRDDRAERRKEDIRARNTSRSEY